MRTQTSNQVVFENMINLISPYGFGDTLILCGFKKALEINYSSEINYVIKPEHEVLMKLYDITNYSLKTFSKQELTEISAKNTEIKIGCEFVAHPEFISNKNLLYSFMNNEISMVDLFRKTLNLPEDVRFEPPMNIPQISLSLQNRLNKIAPLDKIVLLSTEAFSTKRINKFYLEDIVEELKEDGYTVISSVSDKDEVIKGSICMDLSFEEAVAVGINCAKVYAVRSGFVDVLIEYRKSLNIIYPDTKTFKLYSLKDLGYSDVIETIVEGTPLKKIGPVFQIEDKGNERLYRFCLTLFHKKKKRDQVKYCILGLPIFVVKKQVNYKKYYLFGSLCVFRREM